MEGSVSVLDQFRTAEQRVAERLRELKPLVDEYHELQQVAQRLRLNLNEDATATGKQRPASPESTQKRRRGSKTKARSSGSRRTGDSGGPNSGPTSRRQEDVLRLVEQRPGITVSQIAEELGIDATGLYRAVHKLEHEGAISKRGTALQPTGR